MTFLLVHTYKPEFPAVRLALDAEFIYEYMHAYIHTYIHTHTYVYIHRYIYVHPSTYTYTHAFAYTLRVRICSQGHRKLLPGFIDYVVQQDLSGGYTPISD